jgi:hypothetical protein
MLQVTENKIENKGETTIDVIKEPNGIRVKADVIVPSHFLCWVFNGSVQTT